MVYGIRLRDISGNTFTMTPDAMTIVSAGSVSMPASLNVDNTYGTDINLPASDIPVANIGVLVSPRVSAGSNAVVYTRYIDSGTLYFSTFYASSAYTFYTRNDATGVMTSWSAGNRTANSKSTWNPTLSVYPIAFWDKMGAATFTKIRLFAATAHLLREMHNDINASLAGSVTAGGENIKDNNESTYCGTRVNAPPYEENSFGYSYEISFGAKTLTKVEILHNMYGAVWDGSADGNVTVKLYYNSSWNTVIYKGWAQNINQTELLWVNGRWNNVTIISVAVVGWARGGDESSSYCGHYTYELRAWASVYSDDDENKIVYTIGSNGVSTVDYLIGIKKYNY